MLLAVLPAPGDGPLLLLPGGGYSDVDLLLLSWQRR
jgi:hypothetical protein